MSKINGSSEGKQFLSDLKLYSDYLKWDEVAGRYQRYDEVVDEILLQHRAKYGDVINPLLQEVEKPLKNRMILASQRNLQYRGKQIFKHEVRSYNCCTSYCYSPDTFAKTFYILLCGTGVGISLKKKFVSMLPEINPRSEETVTHIVEDSIEGWSDACNALISSYCKHPSLNEFYFQKKIRFDYSQIRPKGAFISGGFKAPGPDGLKRALENIEALLDKNTGTFKSIVAYDIYMHLCDAVLSGGVRRSAFNVVIDEDDDEMINAKMGAWWMDNPQRARSNNSVGLTRGSFTMEQFDRFVRMNDGISDIGFVFMDNENEIFNPCFEIGFCFFDKIKDVAPDMDVSVFQFCNLNEINASSLVDSKGNFSEEKFYEACRSAAILGTMQAGYTSFPYLGKQTEEIVRGESLLGVSITGWMMRPELFENAEILQKGARIVMQTNKNVADLIGIPHAARTTTVKPSGNASTILKTSSGIHPEHSKRYFRIMRLNKETETGKYLKDNMPEILEDDHMNPNKTDYVVYVPCENTDEKILYKNDVMGVKHLEIIKFVKENWVDAGTNESRCYVPTSRHNVSNTVIIDDIDAMVDYIYEHQNTFAAVSFLSQGGDKDYVQAPFTSILNASEIMMEYGDGAIFMSGLIVDGLHIFNNNLWDALEYVKNPDYVITDTNEIKEEKKGWIRRVKKFSKNFFKGDIARCIYCMKDVHLWHKWNVINRTFKNVDFETILTQPRYNDIADYGAVACSGGSCEVVF